MSIRSTLDQTIAEYKRAFRENIERLDNEIIDHSPVDKGRFKTSWQLIEFDLNRFRYRRENNVEYGIFLWRYKKSKKGWSPVGGDAIVSKHTQQLRRDLEAINRSRTTV